MQNAIAVEGEVVSDGVFVTLEDAEAAIERGMGGFREAGAALMWIQDGKKYKDAKFETFVDYCRERWDFSESRAYQQIDAARVVALLEAETSTDRGGNVPSPRSEWTIRPLAKVLHERGEEGVREAWKDIVARKLRQSDLRPDRQRITFRDVSRVVNPPAGGGKPGWFELLGLVGDDLIDAAKHMDRVEAELAAALKRKHPKAPKQEFIDKAEGYAEWAEGLAARLRDLEGAA